MNAPIDIVIDILKREQREASEKELFYSKCQSHDQVCYYKGQADMCQELIDQFNGFKKLFS